MSIRNLPPGWRDDGTCPGWPTQKEREAHKGLWMIRLPCGLMASGKLSRSDDASWFTPFCNCHGWIEQEGSEVWPIDDNGERITITLDNPLPC
jgi:hypothetical protein